MSDVKKGRTLNTLLVSLLILGGVAVWGYWALQDSVSEGMTMGARAPEWQLPDLAGNEWHLDDFAGTPVILRFSSRLCATCAEDFTQLSALQEMYEGRVQVIAVELDAPAQIVENALRGVAYDYPVLIDTSGATGRAYQLDSLPTLVFIDGSGRVMSRTFYRDLLSVDWDAHVAPLLTRPTGLHPDLVAEYEAVIRQLHCLECRGRSVAESTAPIAWDMREEALALLEAGLNRAEVLAYFEEEYGPTVLMQPPRRGSGLLAYVAPFAFLGVGGLVVQWFLLRRRQADRGDDAPSETTAVPSVDSSTEETVRRHLKDYL